MLQARIFDLPEWAVLTEHLVSLVFLCTAAISLRSVTKSLSIPILVPAVRFLMISIISWTIATASRFVSMQSGWNDQLWYWAAVLSCCAPISVLGAKRPTSRIWTVFIILPLIAVLGWPAITAVSVNFPKIVPLSIQLPAFLGFVLVLVMGGGNYMGTRYASSVFWGGVAILLNLITVSNLHEWSQQEIAGVRGLAAMIYGLTILHGIRQSQRPAVEAERFDDLWFDFRDAFGLVWSIRIQDRINQTAQKEQWMVRLGSEGFEWDPKATDTQRSHTVGRLTQTVHWLFRRFVEPEWIDSRLNPEDASDQSVTTS